METKEGLKAALPKGHRWEAQGKANVQQVVDGSVRGWQLAASCRHKDNPNMASQIHNALHMAYHGHI
jgi:hypothetical protein